MGFGDLFPSWTTAFVCQRAKYRAVAESSYDADGDDDDDDHLSHQLHVLGQPPEDSDLEEEVEDEDDDSDLEEEEDNIDVQKPAEVRPAKRRKIKTFATPAPDNDPEEAAPNAVLDEDINQWSRQLRRVFTHPFSGPTPPGPIFGKQAGMRPLYYFFQFFPLALFAYIAQMTNIKLRFANITSLTSTAEIRAWFGIRLVMGLSRLANTKDYWSNRQGFRNELIVKTMTRRRFKVISTYLACSDPQADPQNMPSNTTKEKQDKYNFIRTHPKFYFRRLWDTVIRLCQSKYNCGRNLAIDEAMIPYRGFRACKPIRSGFKVYAMAESATGYICNFMIHTPSKTPKKMVNIAMEVASSHLDCFHHIFTDKLYTSRELASQLLQRGTYLTGAIKTNSIRLPLDLSNNPRKNLMNLEAVQQIKKTRRGTFYVRQSGQLTYTMWNDSSLLSVLSSAHSGFRDHTIDFVTRRYTMDSSKVREARQVPAPPAVIDYCKNMGGVDRGDQLRSYHTINRKSQHWWKQIVCFLVDIARVNAWICYQHHAQPHPEESSDDESPDDELLEDEGSNLNHNHFTMDVAEQLIEGFAHGSKNMHQPPTPPVPLHNFGGLHRLVHMGAKFPKGCKRCARDKKKTPSGIPVKSHFGCAACGVHLCTSYCFPRYHAIAGIPAQDPDGN